jgi:ribonuclease HI
MFRSLPLLFRRAAQFVPICTKSIVKPIEFADVQTDGSFSMGRISRTAVILNTISGERYNLVNTYFNHANSTESEWCSVLNGLTYSLNKGQKAVLLENDNLGVIMSLIRQEPPAKKYYYRYYDDIYDQLDAFHWVEARWIPREMNYADKLFRI